MLSPLLEITIVICEAGGISTYTIDNAPIKSYIYKVNSVLCIEITYFCRDINKKRKYCRGTRNVKCKCGNLICDKVLHSLTWKFMNGFPAFVLANNNIF